MWCAFWCFTVKPVNVLSRQSPPKPPNWFPSVTTVIVIVNYSSIKHTHIPKMWLRHYNVVIYRFILYTEIIPHNMLDNNSPAE